MMLVRRFPMLSRPSRRALLALGTWAVAGCDPGSQGPEARPAAVATARALVRPLVSGNALRTPATRDPSGAAVTPGPTGVVLGHRAADGTLRVGCIDTEDGAEALVGASDEER
ncbi:MAG TPA: hypothetical protein VLQ79_07085 [Myxococcaceae bacterium]|nr:hypothetical protein [Myxococcaceae bacterium]